VVVCGSAWLFKWRVSAHDCGILQLRGRSAADIRHNTTRRTTGMKAHRDILHLVDTTPFVDTHEHLWEEKHRVDALATGRDSGMWSPDIAMLLGHYVDSDLIVAGLSSKDMDKIKGYDLSPKEKWALVEPYYKRSRNTG